MHFKKKVHLNRKWMLGETSGSDHWHDLVGILKKVNPLRDPPPPPSPRNMFPNAFKCIALLDVNACLLRWPNMNAEKCLPMQLGANNNLCVKNKNKTPTVMNSWAWLPATLEVKRAILEVGGDAANGVILVWGEQPRLDGWHSCVGVTMAAAAAAETFDGRDGMFRCL